MRVGLSALSLALFVASCATIPAQAPPPPKTGVRAPKVIKRVNPDYPLHLRRDRVEGEVVIAGTVPKEGGTLRNAHVVRSDDSRLDRLALDAVSAWIWSPGFQDGEAVDVEFTTTISFRSRR